MATSDHTASGGEITPASRKLTNGATAIDTRSCPEADELIARSAINPRLLKTSRRNLDRLEECQAGVVIGRHSLDHGEAGINWIATELARRLGHEPQD